MADRSTQPNPPASGGHTIAVVADRTGLSRDVLRVWERRYKAVEPDRTNGGQRLYSDQQLARFVLLAQATRNGRSIGSIAGLSSAELERILSEDATARNERRGTLPARDAESDGSDATVERAFACTLALDGAGLDLELRLALARSGFPKLLEHTIPALMRRIGDAWMERRLSISHEHAASAIVLSVLLEAIRSFPARPGMPRLLVATPAGEHHVIGAALIAAAAAVDGWRVMFLGADIPAADLVLAAHGVQTVALSMVLADDVESAISEVRTVRQALPSSIPIIIGGAAAVRLRDTLAIPGVTVCHDIAEARALLSAMNSYESSAVRDGARA
ncbi:MAG: MerR family transcriptional regulator [Gemmatimonas sp.]